MRSLKKSAVWISILMIVSKLLGVVREICMARQFGTSYIVDAYIVSSTFPTVLFALFANGFSDSYIPIHVRAKIDKREQLFNNTATFLLISSMLLAGLSFLLRKQLVFVLAPGFDARSTEMTQTFLSIIVLEFPLYVVFALFSARISAEEDFFVPCFCDFVVVNILLIISILISTKESPLPLAYGFVASMAVALIILAVYAKKRYAVTYSPVLNIRDKDFRQLCSLAIPLGVSMIVNQLNTVIDRVFSSTLGEGITSALGYADKIQSILLTLTTSIFLTVCYPRMNKYFAEQKPKEGMIYAEKATMIACYTSIPLTTLLLFFAEPVTRMLFERGLFSAESTLYTATCLKYYAIGILFFAIRAVLSNVLAANTKQHLIMKNTVITVACNVVLNVVFVQRMGYGGLALATSVSGLLACGLLWLDTRKIGLCLLNREEAFDIIRIVIGTAFCILPSVLIFPRLLVLLGNSFAVILATAVAVLLYILASSLLRIKIFLWLYQMLPERLRIF